MQLVVDLGNTLAKAAIFDQDKLIKLEKGLDHIQLINLCNEYRDAKIMFSTVNQEATHVINLVENKSRVEKLSYLTNVPIQNKYTTPETLGMDRLAACVGANVMFKNSNCLVIDAGTCITIDFIDENACFWGGSISPGVQMRLKSLNTFTARLPLVVFDVNEKPNLMGTSTKEAILSGVLNGIVFEVEGIIESYLKRYPDLKVVLCGGDHSFFESRIKHSIFVNPELVLLGLNRILLYNAI